VHLLAGARATTAAAKRTARTKSLKAARLAFGINLAAIKLRALFVITQNFISRGDLGEFFLRLGIARILVGMIFFRELAKGLFHLVGGCRLGHAKH
jgi:hypothetical protein